MTAEFDRPYMSFVLPLMETRLCYPCQSLLHLISSGLQQAHSAVISFEACSSLVLL